MEELFDTEVELQDEQATTEEQAVENADSVEDTESASENAIVSEEKPKLNPYEQAILAEMERRGEDDKQIADGLASKDKSIRECYSYIQAQARKQAVNGCAMIRDDVVFGWAIHYYTEPKSVIDAELKPKPKVNTTTTTKPVTKPTPKKKASYNDNPLLKSLSKKGKKKSETKQKGTEKTREVKKGGNVFTITEFTLF